MLMSIHKKQCCSIVHYPKKQAQASLMPFHHHLPCVHSSWWAWDYPHWTFVWAELHEQWVWLKGQWSIRLTWLVWLLPTGTARSVQMGVREHKGSHCKSRGGGTQAGWGIGDWREWRKDWIIISRYDAGVDERTLAYSIDYETNPGKGLLHLAEAEDELLNGGRWICTLISTVKST